MELNREHFRAIIFYNFRRELTQKQCIDELKSIFGDEAPSRTNVYRWYGEFNWGSNSPQDEFREGRSKSVVVPEIIDVVRQLILHDRHVTYREIGTTLGISGGQHTFNIAWKVDCKKNLFALDPTQFVNRSKQRLVSIGRKKCSKNTIAVVRNTSMTSWIYAYEPESKQQSTVCVFQDEPNSTMIACFSGKTEHVAIIPLEQHRIVNSKWFLFSNPEI